MYLCWFCTDFYFLVYNLYKNNIYTTNQDYIKILIKDRNKICFKDFKLNNF